jgi:hypothetical protein
MINITPPQKAPTTVVKDAAKRLDTKETKTLKQKKTTRSFSAGHYTHKPKKTQSHWYALSSLANASRESIAARSGRALSRRYDPSNQKMLK